MKYMLEQKVPLYRKTINSCKARFQYVRGHILLRLANKERAVGALSCALILNPRIDLMIKIANTLFDIECFEKAQEVYAQVLPMTGDRVPVMNRIAECSLWRERLEEAIDYCEGLIQNGDATSYTYWISAVAHYQLEALEKAHAASTQGLIREPDAPWLIMIHGLILARMKDENAYAWLIRGERNCANSPPDWLNLADGFSQCACNCKALAYVERYVSRCGETPYTLLLRGNCHFHMKRYELAIEALSRVPLEAKEYAQANITIAACHFNRRNYEEGSRHIRELVLEKPNCEVLVEACRDLLRDGDPQDVVNLCTAHNEFVSDNARLQALLARALFCLGKSAEAVACLERATASKGKDVAILESILDAYIVAGDIDAARRTLHELEAL